MYKSFVGMQGRSGGVSSACWHVRTASRFALWDWLVVGRNYVWCLVIDVIFMGFGRAGARCRRCLKGVNWGWRCKSQKGSSFHREGRVSLHVILLYCETLLQILLGIYCKKFYWIPLFTILLLCCFTCLRLAKPKVQLRAS